MRGKGNTFFTRKAERRLRYSSLPALSSRSLWRRRNPYPFSKKSDELFYLYFTYPCREQNQIKSAVPERVGVAEESVKTFLIMFCLSMQRTLLFFHIRSVFEQYSKRQFINWKDFVRVFREAVTAVQRPQVNFSILGAVFFNTK